MSTCRVCQHTRQHNENQVKLLGADALIAFTTSWGFCTSPAHYTLYVAAKFDQPYRHFTTWVGNKMQRNVRVARGRRTGAWLAFGDRREVKMKIALSYASQSGALANLNSELPGWDFEAVQAQAVAIWTKLLDKIAIEGGTPDQHTIFATALYHSFLTPTLFSDHNGDYIGFDSKTHSLAGSQQTAQYANYSDWDTYRNTVQLQALLAPEIVNDMMQSLVNDSVEGGIVPRWPLANQSTYEMAGDSSNILWASGYAFGARRFDAETALRYMVKGGTQSQKNADRFLYIHYYTDAERTFLPEYLKLGYVPAMEDPVSVSRTLEYVNDDFAVAQLATNLGDASEFQHFIIRSQNWQNLFDPQTKWMRPRLADCTWLHHFDVWLALPKQNTWGESGFQYGFEEGNTARWSFTVPFDYPEEFAAMGGDAEVVARLDRFFCREPSPVTASCFTAANEHNFVTPYAYVFAGEPWKTQEVVGHLLGTAFQATPNGLPGNDDLGATSGFYVWNALGFYPAIPG